MTPIHPTVVAAVAASTRPTTSLPGPSGDLT